MSDSNTKTTGIWVDPLTVLSGSVPRGVSATVQQTVRHLTRDVVKNVNKVFSLDLSPNEMAIDHYPPS